MISLDRLINVLGGYGVRLRRSPVERSTVLRSVVLPEIVGGAAVAGDVLLAVGAASPAEALQWALAARATVVLTRDDDHSDLQTDSAGIAVMLIDPAVAWSELAAIVFGLVFEGRETESGRGPTDLFALADTLRDTTGGAVVIEDRHSQVLAYSRGQQHADPARAATILERRAPEALRTVFEKQGVFTHLAVSDAPIFVPGDPAQGLTGRMVVAARAGRELLGSVWIACPQPLRGEASDALADGAHVAALHLLRSRASADLERQVESESVLRLLDGPADAATMASRLGLPPQGLRVVALRAHEVGERHAAMLLAFDRATTGYGWSRPGRSGLADTTIYTALAAADVSTARQWVQDLTAALPPQVTVLAGISAPAAVADLTAARREAEECLAMHETTDAEGSPPAYDESWDSILLRRLRTAAHSGRGPKRGTIAALGVHDDVHGTRYVSTLRAWLQEQGDPVRTAERLGVHENTVRYRMRRMAEITDLRLADADKRFAMMVELALFD